jgi:MFS family permease
MEFADLTEMTKRAAAFTLQKKKLAFTSIVLFFSGLILLFGMAVGISLGPWLSMSLFFIPLFITLGALMGLGVLLIRSYHDEVKQKDSSIKSILLNSWAQMLGAIALFVPIVLGYLCLWVLMGLFLLCSEIPIIGPVFAVLFAFIPFIMNVVVLAVILFAVYLLFSLTPTFALTNFWQDSQFVELVQKAVKRTSSLAILFVLGLVPFLFSFGLLLVASLMTMSFIAQDESQLQLVLQWFFIMLPFVLLLTPSVVFFFNMATEAHIYLQKKVLTEGK